MIDWGIKALVITYYYYHVEISPARFSGQPNNGDNLILRFTVE